MAQRFQLDDTVYFRDGDKSICYGIVGGLTRNRVTGETLVLVENVRDSKDPPSSKRIKYGQATISEKCCDATEDELLQTIAIEERAACDFYRWGINSVEDLIKFALDNDVSGKSFRIECDEPEVADEIRRKRVVFIEKAEELLGITGLPVEFHEHRILL